MPRPAPDEPSEEYLIAWDDGALGADGMDGFENRSLLNVESVGSVVFYFSN